MRALSASYPVAVLLAVCLHALLAVFLLRTPSDANQNTFVQPKAIKASLVQYEKPKPKAKPVAKKVVKKAELKPQTSIAKKKEPEVKKVERKKVEPKKKVEEKAAPPPKETSTLDETLDELLADDANQLQEEEDLNKVQRYSLAIENAVYRRWSRPPSARNNMKSVLVVRLLPSGDIVSVVVQESSGNDAFDRSAISAVKRVERFEFVREMDSRLFEKNFRVFNMKFSPQDLRL